MAKFKVGDRVKYVSGLIEHVPVGSIGTVESHSSGQQSQPYYIVNFHPIVALGDRKYGPNHFHVRQSSLAPLVPPAEDAWASEKVKQVTKVQPVAPVPVWS